MQADRRVPFGVLLKQFRLDAGMTQQGLADRANVSVEAISTLERGARTRPQRETVDLLAFALELTPEREALLRSASDSSRGPARRDALDASLLRLVRPGAQAAPRHNLAQQRTSFVGRQREAGEIAALLREHRLVTLVGAGGVGKTRVAVQTASVLLDGYPDGVWLVDLAPLADRTLVASSVLAALGLPSTTQPPLDAVIAYLKTRRLLLILDNCEHVIAQARDVADNIAQACPRVRVLATSREALDVPGEAVYRLPSLAVAPDSCRTVRDVTRYGAITLFADRALAVDAGFTFTDDNAQDVAEICRRLDGIPLAIELAAARVNVLAPRQIAQRLDQRFRLLTGGDPRALPRHQTMTALIEWSYDLLSAREQRFFEDSSVFAGACTLEAVTAVCATDGEDDVAVIDLIASLVKKSLLVAELAGSEQRYWMLESSRQYARDKLSARGDRSHLERRHALFYVELAERLDRAWETASDHDWFSQTNVELENWRAALEWALARHGDVVLGQRLAGARHVLRRGFTPLEARRWVGAALDLVDDDTPCALVAGLELADAMIAGRLAERTACLAGAERALKRYRELGDPVGIARAQTVAGHSLVIFQRFAEAESLLREASEVARRLGLRRLAVDSLLALGSARSLVYDFTGARAFYAEALGLARAVGSELYVASVAAWASGNEYDAGEFETGLLLATEAMEVYRRLGPSSLSDLATSLGDVAKFLIALGRYDDALAPAREALEAARGVGHAVMMAMSLQELAVLALLAPQIRGGSATMRNAAAARIFGFVDRCLAHHGIPKIYGLPEYDRALELLRDAIGADEVARLMTAGAPMTEDEAIEQAHSLPGGCGV